MTDRVTLGDGDTLAEAVRDGVVVALAEPVLLALPLAERDAVPLPDEDGDSEKEGDALAETVTLLLPLADSDADDDAVDVADTLALELGVDVVDEDDVSLELAVVDGDEEADTLLEAVSLLLADDDKDAAALRLGVVLGLPLALPLGESVAVPATQG